MQVFTSCACMFWLDNCLFRANEATKASAKIKENTLRFAEKEFFTISFDIFIYGKVKEVSKFNLCLPQCV